MLKIVSNFWMNKVLFVMCERITDNDNIECFFFCAVQKIRDCLRVAHIHVALPWLILIK